MKMKKLTFVSERKMRKDFENYFALLLCKGLFAFKIYLNFKNMKHIYTFLSV